MLCMLWSKTEYTIPISVSVSPPANLDLYNSDRVPYCVTSLNKQRDCSVSYY